MCLSEMLHCVLVVTLRLGVAPGPPHFDEIVGTAVMLVGLNVTAQKYVWKIQVTLRIGMYTYKRLYDKHTQFLYSLHQQVHTRLLSVDRLSYNAFRCARYFRAATAVSWLSTEIGDDTMGI